MSIKIVAAMDKNGGIGLDNGLPWGKPIPADMQHFRELTMDKIVVMGRPTWESIPPKFRPLPHRKENIVLTRNPNFIAEGGTVIHEISSIRRTAETNDVYIIGGAEIYAIFIPFATQMHITVVEGVFPSDTKFPEYDLLAWKQVRRVPIPKSDSNMYPLQFITLVRISPTA